MMKQLIPTFYAPDEVNRVVADEEEKVFAAAVMGGAGSYS